MNKNLPSISFIVQTIFVIVLLFLLPTIITYLIYKFSGNNQAIEAFNIISCNVDVNTSFIQKFSISILLFVIVVYVFVQYIFFNKKVQQNLLLILAFFVVLVSSDSLFTLFYSLGSRPKSNRQNLWKNAEIPLFKNYLNFMNFLDILAWICVVLATIVFFYVFLYSIRTKQFAEISIAAIVALLTFILMYLVF